MVSLGFLVAVRDSPEVTPHSALLSLGLPRFPGLVILAQCIHTLAFGMAISTCMDAYILTWASIAHLIHPICLCLGLPRSVSEFFNPIWYPPWFNQLLESNSVAQFWNKSWHQLLKRGFVCCGGKPGVNLARLLGLRPQAQRIVGLFGIFAASGLYHEYGEAFFFFFFNFVTNVTRQEFLVFIFWSFPFFFFFSDYHQVSIRWAIFHIRILIYHSRLSQERFCFSFYNLLE